LGRSEDVAIEAAQLVSETCYFLLSRIKANELSDSAQEKLVRFLLEVHPGRPGPDGETRLKLDLSQEAIGQMIGTSRETVARLLSRLKKEGVLDWGRSKIIIRDRRALEKLAES